MLNLSKLFKIFKRNKKTDEVKKCDFPIDFTRIDDINYLTQEGVFNYLSNQMIELKELVLKYDASDIDETRFNKEILIMKFGKHLRANANNKPYLRKFITELLFKDNIEKIYYVKTCVVCLENKSKIFLKPCNHIVTCLLCYEIIMKTSKKCPMCRRDILGVFVK